ncbi:uncharacterized protein M421DRAFT_353245 [Didymella exigua CBS 183.55]|uniref:Uncharacterized protein n=1 Tax=Didymella exigua CBS 183.55 TaxID=1150837 RepID=A0A6A5R3G3_9PLEO|nr:uncharacterized protein M421DRAFT_353245 [Didymella exigua CBS 183.55]KAF1922601.1 hypothetical protein M421DRAFT_353245 [Didymella exigua CBS 183.55]
MRDLPLLCGGSAKCVQVRSVVSHLREADEVCRPIIGWKMHQCRYLRLEGQESWRTLACRHRIYRSGQLRASSKRAQAKWSLHNVLSRIYTGLRESKLPSIYRSLVTKERPI